ncbi:hypothetical protein ZN88_15455 [Salmonella enterica subsp. enterica serovar Newport]|nr:hypothetical protein [Salmonella enterica subsp. enterica serovar Newport]
MLLKTAERLVKEQALKDYPQKISVGIPDKSVPQYNYKCHINAAQAVKTGMAVGVVETVVMYNEMCIAHYVSLMADGKYVDFTLGIEILNRDVRFVRIVHPNEYDRMNDVLWDLKKHLCRNLPWYIPVNDKLLRNAC